MQAVVDYERAEGIYSHPARQELSEARAAVELAITSAPAYTAPEVEKLRAVFEAAYGLCMGYDWNNGTAAKAAGYRRKLLSAVNAIKAVPDFEDKYRGSTLSSTDRGAT
jgi:hypothetical protein